MLVASGASGDVVGIEEEEPMCIETVVWVSSHACHRGSQSPEYNVGNPSFEGFSLNAIA